LKRDLIKDLTPDLSRDLIQDLIFNRFHLFYLKNKKLMTDRKTPKIIIPNIISISSSYFLFFMRRPESL
jgi:hypothetical protein